MRLTLARKGAMIAAALLAIGLASPASATDSMTWNPQTPAGGLVAPPGYWDTQAMVPFAGPGSTVTNVTLAPSFVDSKSTTSNTTYDYSKPTTNVSGDENNTTVNTGATMGDGSSLSVSTTSGK